MRRAGPLLLVAAAAILAAGCDDGSGPGPTPLDSAVEAAAATITPTYVGDWIARLADDSTLGRDTPSPQLGIVAGTIALTFLAQGLPGAFAGDYMQFWPFVVPPGPATGSPRAPRASDAPNVAAVLQGSDPARRGQVVVVVAHMDHLGIGPAVGGDSIYNGADDNASGTAALLAIARAFASLPEAPPRTVLFLAVSGEEYGLWGSEYFAAHPPVPVDSIVAAVNLDMISRNSVTTVLVGGLLLSTLGDQATAAAARHPELALAVAPGPAGGSDHVPFAARDIPWIFFFTGLHATYHTPDDEVALTDPNQAARIARLAFYTVHAAASTPERPAWKVGFGAAVP